MTMSADELLIKLIKSQEEVVKIWEDYTTLYGKGNYNQALATLKFLKGYL